MATNSANGRAHARPFGFSAGRRSPAAWLIRLVLLGVLLSLLARMFVLQVFVVASGSMSPTLQTDDRILVWKPASWSTPQRGEIVVFDGRDSFVSADLPTPAWWKTLLVAEPLDRRWFVKRVVAIAGDHLQCCDASGALLLNGKVLNEPYLHGTPSDIKFDVVVPAGRMFLMGDHRSESFDSRSLLGRPGGGMIGYDQIVGRVLAVGWPTSRIGAVA